MNYFATSICKHLLTCAFFIAFSSNAPSQSISIERISPSVYALIDGNPPIEDSNNDNNPLSVGISGTDAFASVTMEYSIGTSSFSENSTSHIELHSESFAHANVSADNGVSYWNFAITEDTSISLTLEINVSGLSPSASPSAALIINGPEVAGAIGMGVDGSYGIYDLIADGGHKFFSASYLLGPGDYVLRPYSTLDYSANPGVGSVTQTVNYAATFDIIPEPASTCLLIGGVIVTALGRLRKRKTLTTNS